MTLMGGPIDPRVNPTAVNQLATSRSLDWFERNVIAHRAAALSRRVPAGLSRLPAARGLHDHEFDRHITAHVDLFKHLVRGDGEGVDGDARLLRRVHVGDGPARRILSPDHRARVPAARAAAGQLHQPRPAGRARGDHANRALDHRGRERRHLCGGTDRRGRTRCSPACPTARSSATFRPRSAITASSTAAAGAARSIPGCGTSSRAHG